MKLVVIDNYDSFTFNLVQMLGERCGHRPLVFKNDELGPREVEALAPDGVVLSPGPGHPREAGRLIEIVRDLSPEIPVFGVCLGHQAIVEAFGGKVVGAGEIVHGKTSDVRHEDCALLDGLPSPFRATRYHSLVGERATFPSCLRITAETNDGLIMALEHTSRPIHAVQFHPESFATGVGGTILANFIAICSQARPSLLPRGSAGARLDFGALLEQVIVGKSLSRDVARALGDQVLAGELTPAQIGALAYAFRAKGEDTEELTGFANAFRSLLAPNAIKAPPGTVSVGVAYHEGSNVFDPMPGAAFVAAAGGAPVSVLVDPARERVGRELGIEPVASRADAEARLAKQGVIFVNLRTFAPALAHLPHYGELGSRTLLDVVARVADPTFARRSLLSATTEHTRDALARTAKALGSEHVLVVLEDEGLGALSPDRRAHLVELRNGVLSDRVVGEAGGRTIPAADVRTSSTDVAARTIAALNGEANADRAAIVMNAAALLYLGGRVDTIAQGIDRASALIDSGAARERLALFKP